MIDGERSKAPTLFSSISGRIRIFLSAIKAWSAAPFGKVARVLEVPDLNDAASTLNEITKFGFYEDQIDKDTLQ